MRRIRAALLLSFLAASVLMPTACSHINESDRLTVISVIEKDTIAAADTTQTDSDVIFDPFEPQGIHVLIEDFTGQDCVNCPNATDLISQLQEMHGHDRVIAVGIHSGPLGVKPADKPDGLATELGDTYYNYWQIEMQPYGVIDRSDGPLSTDWWTAKVNWDLDPSQPDPAVNIWVDASISDESKTDIMVTLAAYQYCKAKLQLWIVEDNITAFQKMPDGKTKNDYVHNHVLRDAVNGAWGDEFSLEANETKEFTYAYSIPSSWKTADLAIVAFAYNDEKVVQVARENIKVKD